MSELNNKIVNATKWSAITEVIAKLVTPISTMVLARLLTPEAYGVVATVTMIISFAEIFTDAGFQRYIIQHEFTDESDKYKTTTVAFWSNLTMSLAIWAAITMFCEPLASLVGNPGLGNVIVVACVSIPLAAFSSIQIALYKRELNFKKLFYVRLAGILIPLFVTIPLAIWLRSYWALILGTIVVNCSNAIILSVNSKWRPNLYYSFKRLKEMFSFCSWTIIDTILVWSTNYLDVFLVGVYLSAFYLGLYKTSIATVGHITALISAAVLPVMLPSLSRLQNNYSELRALLLKFQKYMSVLLLPLGVGIFLYSDLVTEILLGKQWMEAAPFIGLWGLMDVTSIIFSRFCSVIYPAIGKPRISAIVQILHLVVLIPAVIISVKYGFTALYWTRSLVRFELIIVNVFFAYYLIKQSPLKMLINVMPEIISCAIMAIISYLLYMISDSLAWTIVSIFICVISYTISITCFPKERDILKDVMLHTIKKK